MQKAFRLFMATLTVLWSTAAFADVAPSTWGAVKGLYQSPGSNGSMSTTPGTTSVNVYQGFPSQWKLPFYGSMQISVYYGGAYCWGGRDAYHSGSEYYALDWNLPGENDFGKPVLAPASGWMTTGYSSGGYGNYVYVIAGNGYSYRLAHLDRFAVNYCGWVERGQLLGYIGHTGASQGSHLHFVVYRNGSSVPQNGMSGISSFALCQYYSSGQ